METMTLREWREKVAKLSLGELAALVRHNHGSKSYETVRRWDRGLGVPRGRDLAILVMLGKGYLRPQSFGQQNEWKLEVTADEFDKIIHRQQAPSH